jgi:hypothetical protein
VSLVLWFNWQDVFQEGIRCARSVFTQQLLWDQWFVAGAHCDACQCPASDAIPPGQDLERQVPLYLTTAESHADKSIYAVVNIKTVRAAEAADV